MDIDNGILLIDKPTKMTSHDVVNIIRKITGIKTIGHAGTLDPLATGLLIILVGKAATKKSSEFLHMDKKYEIDMLLGIETDSGDTDGQTTNQLDSNHPSLDISTEKIKHLLLSFAGSYQQQVPLFSAVKIKGQKLYQHGRKLRTQPDSQTSLVLPKRLVTIHQIEYKRAYTDNMGYHHVVFAAHVSSGTYTRSLIQDIAKQLGTLATQAGLVRTMIGPYPIDQAHAIDTITTNDIIPIAKVNLRQREAPSSNG